MPLKERWSAYHKHVTITVTRWGKISLSVAASRLSPPPPPKLRNCAPGGRGGWAGLPWWWWVVVFWVLFP